MKRLIILCLLLTGCNESFMNSIHADAKRLNGTRSVCYRITSPEDLKGDYCVRFKPE